MALRQALVDRARILGQAATATKVEGRRRFTPTTGPWFQVRITERETQGTLEDGRERVDRQLEMLFWATDEFGGEVTITPDVKVEIVSNIANGIFQVKGRPEIFRRRSSLVGGGMCTIERVDEPPDTRST